MQQGQYTVFTLFTCVERPAEMQFEAFYHPILVHEGTHLYLQQYLGRNSLPDLLNEGISTYFQGGGLPMANGGEQPPRRSAFAKRALGLLVPGKLPKLSELCDYDDLNVDRFGPQACLNYFCAEMMIEYLLSSEAGRRHLSTWFDQACDGRLATTKVKTVLDGMQAAWEVYILEHAPARR